MRPPALWPAHARGPANRSRMGAAAVRPSYLLHGSFQCAHPSYCPVPNRIDFGSQVTGDRPPLSLQDAHARLLPRVRVRAHVNMGPQEGRCWHVAIITFLGSTIHGIERIMPGTRSSRWAQKMPPSDCYSTLEIEIEEAGCRCHPKGSGLQPGKCSDGKDSRIDALRLDGLYDR